MKNDRELMTAERQIGDNPKWLSNTKDSALKTYR